MKIGTVVWIGTGLLILLLGWGCGKKQTEEAAPPAMAVNESNVGPTKEESPAAEAPATSEETVEKITYTCPMHPEVQQDKPGKCPKCGMFLEAKVPEGTEVTYTCPMHPEVKQDKPGECPKCGMALEAKITASKGEAAK